MPDASTSQLAISALGGGLLTATLSYLVRIIAESRATKIQMRKSATSAYVQLTEVFVTNFILKETIESVRTFHQSTESPGTLSHHAAIAMADMITAGDSATRKQTAALLTTFADAAEELNERLAMSPSDLANLPTDTIYLYGRYAVAAHRLLTAYKRTIEILDSDDVSQITSHYVHGLFRTYNAYVEASSLLRAAYMAVAALSTKYADFCIERSYKVQKREIAETLLQYQSLGRAIEKAKLGEALKSAASDKPAANDR